MRMYVLLWECGELLAQPCSKIKWLLAVIQVKPINKPCDHFIVTQNTFFRSCTQEHSVNKPELISTLKSHKKMPIRHSNHIPKFRNSSLWCSITASSQSFGLLRRTTFVNQGLIQSTEQWQMMGKRQNKQVCNHATLQWWQTAKHTHRWQTSEE